MADSDALQDHGVDSNPTIVLDRDWCAAEFRIQSGSLSFGFDDVIGVSDEDPRRDQHVILHFDGHIGVALEIEEDVAMGADADFRFAVRSR